MRRLVCILITSFIIFISSLACAQSPKKVKSFFSSGGHFCSNYLTLYDDGNFYWYGPCENDIAIATGTWEINNNKLYLTGLDSVKAYPKAKVTIIEGDVDSIKFIIKDKYNRPFPYFGITAFNSKSGQNYFSDTLGTFKIPTGEYDGFYLNYQINSPMKEELEKIDSLLIASIKGPVKEVIVNVDTPSFEGLDRGLIIYNYPDLTFSIKKDDLYDENGQLVYKKINH